MKNTINEYLTEKGESPYANWLDSLKDARHKAIILSHIDRLELGSFGDSKSVGNGVMELRIHIGPGYRVYYAREGKDVYLLLCAGSKAKQQKRY